MDGMETAVMDAPVATETPAAEPSTGQTETPPATQQQPDERVDGRQKPDALRKTLKWLRENGGEHSAQAQVIERILGEGKSYKNAFPTVREARDIRTGVETLTGEPYNPKTTPAKLAEVQQYVSNMRDVDAKLEAGDPSVVSQILETGSKGIAKILPTLIDELAKTNGDEVAAAIQPHARTFMQNQGLFDAIDAMVNAFNGNKPDEAKSILSRVVNWARGLGQAKSDASPDPQQTAFQAERDKFYQEKFQSDVAGVFNPILEHAQTTILAKLEPDAKRLGWSEEYTDLKLKDIWKVIEGRRNRDPLFKSGIGQHINEKGRKVGTGAKDFLNSFTEKYFDEAYRLVMGPHLKSATPPKPGVKQNPVAPPAGATIAIDYAVTKRKYGDSGAQDAILAGKAFDKAGKPIKKVGKVWQYA